MNTLVKKALDNKTVLFIAVLAIVVRFAFIFNAYHGDLNNNISWGTIAYEKGFKDFYGSSKAEDWPYSAPNQPPLTILLFSLVRAIYLGLENCIGNLNSNFQIFPSKLVWFWDEKGMTLLIKIPSILADLGIGIVIYKYLKNLKIPENKSLIAASMWLLNPITWYNSSIWGQTDPIVNLLGLIGLIFLLRGKLIKSAVFFTLSFLFKGSLLIFLPIIGAIFVKKKYSFNNFLAALGISIVVVWIVGIWFHPSIDFPIWLYKLYTQRILPGEIGYLTAGAFNFWWLIDSGKVYDSKILFGASSRMVGLFMAMLVFIYIFYNLLKSKLADRYIWMGIAVISMAAFLFITRMHGRYLYPAFIPLTLLSVQFNKISKILVILSVTFLANMYYGFWYPPVTLIETSLKTGGLAGILAVINIFVFLYLLKLFRHFDTQKVSTI